MKLFCPFYSYELNRQAQNNTSTLLADGKVVVAEEPITTL